MRSFICPCNDWLWLKYMHPKPNPKCLTVDLLLALPCSRLFLLNIFLRRRHYQTARDGASNPKLRGRPVDDITPGRVCACLLSICPPQPQFGHLGSLDARLAMGQDNFAMGHRGQVLLDGHRHDMFLRHASCPLPPALCLLPPASFPLLTSPSSGSSDGLRYAPPVPPGGRRTRRRHRR